MYLLLNYIFAGFSLVTLVTGCLYREWGEVGKTTPLIRWRQNVCGGTADSVETNVCVAGPLCEQSKSSSLRGNGGFFLVAVAQSAFLSAPCMYAHGTVLY